MKESEIKAKHVEHGETHMLWVGGLKRNWFKILSKKSKKPRRVQDQESQEKE